MPLVKYMDYLCVEALRPERRATVAESRKSVRPTLLVPVKEVFAGAPMMDFDGIKTSAAGGRLTPRNRRQN